MKAGGGQLHCSASSECLLARGSIMLFATSMHVLCALIANLVSFPSHHSARVAGERCNTGAK